MSTENSIYSKFIRDLIEAGDNTFQQNTSTIDFILQHKQISLDKINTQLLWETIESNNLSAFKYLIKNKYNPQKTYTPIISTLSKTGNFLFLKEIIPHNINITQSYGDEPIIPSLLNFLYKNKNDTDMFDIINLGEITQSFTTEMILQGACDSENILYSMVLLEEICPNLPWKIIERIDPKTKNPYFFKIIETKTDIQDICSFLSKRINLSKNNIVAHMINWWAKTEKHNFYNDEQFWNNIKTLHTFGDVFKKQNYSSDSNKMILSNILKQMDDNKPIKTIAEDFLLDLKIGVKQTKLQKVKI